ncbi:MAG: hypothetical protein ACPGJV_03085 [Bacteriovoracaceae bacterium]
MSLIKESQKMLEVSIEEYDLTPAQVRLMKSLNALMLEAMSTPDEHQFFDSCAEIMRVCAGMIKQSSFPRNQNSNIPYAKQAIEFSMDILQEHLEKKSVVRYDN